MMEIIANAKVNLFLEITGKLLNGYHTVDTVMQSISLSDIVKIELLSGREGIKLECSDSNIPADERNIACKIANAFLTEISADCGVAIKIEKNIPSQAGMGGGSSDGAAVLVGLNRLCGNTLTTDQLKTIASKYGADIPFCIDGGTQRMGGIGTHLIERFNSPELHIVIAKPEIGISTPDAYKLLDRMHNDFSKHTAVVPERLIEALRLSDHSSIQLNMYNRFEEVLTDLCYESLDMISFLNNYGVRALLSGSGSAVFGIAESRSHALKIADMLKERFPDRFVCISKTSNCSCIY